jgi:hypothetical protein
VLFGATQVGTVLKNELLGNIGPINATPIQFDQDGVESSLRRMDRALIAADHQQV